MKTPSQKDDMINRGGKLRKILKDFKFGRIRSVGDRPQLIFTHKTRGTQTQHTSTHFLSQTTIVHTPRKKHLLSYPNIKPKQKLVNFVVHYHDFNFHLQL